MIPPPTVHVFLCQRIRELKMPEWFCPVPLVFRRVAADSIAVDSTCSWVGTHGRAHPPLGRVGVGVFVVQMPQELPICDFLPSYLLSELPSHRFLDVIAQGPSDQYLPPLVRAARNLLALPKLELCELLQPLQGSEGLWWTLYSPEPPQSGCHYLPLEVESR